MSSASAPRPDSRPGAARLNSLDALRGLIMVIMALDHVRDFVHASAMTFNPTDLTRTWPALFFTRWITHFCAPVFFFSAGAGAFLWRERGRSNGALSRFLLTRGAWLIVLEVTVMRFGYQFATGPSQPLLLVVLFTLGASMIALAALCWIPVRALAVLSVATIALHNLLDGIKGPPVLLALHQVSAFRAGGWTIVFAYPLIPWIAVMAAGFAFGRVLLLDAVRRRRIAATIGAAATLGFLVMRTVTRYGDPAPWTSGLLSFLNTTKYPPSLDFLFMTLGPALLLFAWIDGRRVSDRNPFVIFGRVPLFYFVLHFYAAHLLAVALAFVRYGNAAGQFAFRPFPSMGGDRSLFPSDFGWPLGVAYACWIAVVAATYRLCRWFAGVKTRRRDWWLGYL